MKKPRDYERYEKKSDRYGGIKSPKNPVSVLIVYLAKDFHELLFQSGDMSINIFNDKGIMANARAICQRAVEC